MKINNLHRAGFTLLELMLVIGILVIIATMSRDFYGSFVPTAQLEDNAKTIIYDLRNARDRAMNGQESKLWGIHFVNGASDYYEVFSTPSDYNDIQKTVLVTSYLRNGITFSSPSEGTNFDIIFSKISGQVASSSITLQVRNNFRTIFVKEQGLIN